MKDSKLLSGHRGNEHRSGSDPPRCPVSWVSEPLWQHICPCDSAQGQGVARALAEKLEAQLQVRSEPASLQIIFTMKNENNNATWSRGGM